MRTLHGTQPADSSTPVRRLLTRVLLASSAGTAIAQTRSLLPRQPQDQALISAGGGALGAATALAAEAATALLGRALGGRRLAAAVLLGAAGGAAAALDRRGRARSSTEALARTTAQAFGVAALGGELGVRAWGRVPAKQRGVLTDRAWTALIAAGSAAGALKSKLAEPGDPIKATIRYPRLPTVSGGDDSLLPFSQLDREGRKFVGCAVPGERISEAMGADALDPIRVFAGLDHAETPQERAALAVAELLRLGALERSRIVFYCPTGAGLVDPVAVETEELLCLGDVASVAVQYANKRSVRAMKALPVARETWRSFLEQLGAALAMSNGTRPELVVYGESLGAWVIAEAIAEQGAGAVHGLGIDRGALIGVPYPARVKLRAVRDAGDPLPEGVAIHSSLDELVTLSDEEQERIRYLVFTHPEDPVGLYSGRNLIWQRPEWLERGKGRSKRIPGAMRWWPGITWLQLLFDLKNGTGSLETFSAYAHDYRLELPALLRIAWGHGDVSDEQLQAIEQETVRLAARQAEREERAKVGLRSRR